MDLDQVHLPDPISSDILKLQNDNLWMRRKIEELEEIICKFHQEEKIG